MAVFSLSTIAMGFVLSVNKCSPNKHCPITKSGSLSTLCAQVIRLIGSLILWPVIGLNCITLPVLIFPLVSICQKIDEPGQCFELPIKYFTIRCPAISSPKREIRNVTKLFALYPANDDLKSSASINDGSGFGGAFLIFSGCIVSKEISLSLKYCEGV